MRGYHYYLDKPARIDNVFGGWRFEKWLEEISDPAQFQARLEAEGIDAVVINLRFFLQDNNADTWNGRTVLLRERFSNLLQSGVLTEQHANGPVRVYSLSDSKSSADGISD